VVHSTTTLLTSTSIYILTSNTLQHTNTAMGTLWQTDTVCTKPFTSGCVPVMSCTSCHMWRLSAHCNLSSQKQLNILSTLTNSPSLQQTTSEQWWLSGG